MILARADYDFLAAGDDPDSDRHANASARYLWLTQIHDAHDRAQTQNVDPGVRSVLRSATNRLKSLQAELNYFGHGTSYVPMGSVKYWTGETKQALQAFQAFEPHYQDYVNRGLDQKARLAGLTRALNDSNQRITALQQRHQTLLSQLPAVVASIDSLDYAISAHNANLKYRLGQLEDAITSACGLSWKDFFSAIGSLAFLQGSPLNKGSLLASKALELGNQAFNDIVADDGTHINKKLMLNKLLVKGRDFDDLPEGFKMVAHEVSLGDPSGVKLLHLKQDLDTFLDKIASWDAAQQVRTQLDSYVHLVSSRNDQVLTYNSLVRRVLQLEADIEAEKTHAQVLQGDQGNIDPDLAHVVNYMGQVYRLLGGAFVNCLYMSIRAASFWALDNGFALQSVTGGPVDPHQLTSATAQSWHTSATQLLSDANETLGGGRQVLDEVVYTIDHTATGFAQVCSGKGHEVHFRIKPVRKSTTVSESPFAGWADVRTEKVEVRLKGAKYCRHRGHRARGAQTSGPGVALYRQRQASVGDPRPADHRV